MLSKSNTSLVRLMFNPLSHNLPQISAVFSLLLLRQLVPAQKAVSIAVKTISDYAPKTLQEVIFVVSSDYIADEYLTRIEQKD